MRGAGYKCEQHRLVFRCGESTLAAFAVAGRRSVRRRTQSTIHVGEQRWQCAACSQAGSTDRGSQRHGSKPSSAHARGVYVY